MSNPYLLPNPSVISFSGGRTSGYMLRKVLDAFGGVLPGWVKVLFENTGKEREETLEFVERCSQQWDVPITWLEYRWEPGRHYFVEVDFASASRKGEPFEQVIKARGMLPNPIARFCTVELKIRTSNRYIRQSLGWDKYSNAVGLRADEPKRVAKMIGGVKSVESTLFGDVITGLKRTNPSTGESPICPLAAAGATLDDVMKFWAINAFDLGLNQNEGNCDLCFLKAIPKQLAILKSRPGLAEWWVKQEQEQGQGRTRNKSVEHFRMDRPGYAELLAIATDKQQGPGWLWADNANGSCGELDECRCTD